MNATSIKIVWTKQNEADSITIQYIYHGPCNCSSMDYCLWKSIDNVTDRIYVVGNLQEYSTYLFKVVAHNPAGQSPTTTTTVRTLQAGK